MNPPTQHQRTDLVDGNGDGGAASEFPDQTGDLVVDQKASFMAPASSAASSLAVGESGSTHLTITVSYDSSVTSLATSNPTLYADFTAAVQTAVLFYENAITNPITVAISFGWGEVDGSAIESGASGESETYQYTTTYASLYAAVAKTETNSAVQLAAVASLPTTDPTGGATFSVATAEAKALGFNTTRYTIGGFVGLDATGTTWSWSQSNVVANTEDAVGTLEHEISEVLGRSDSGGQDNEYSLLDMFRYTAAGGGANDASGTAVGARDEPFVSGYSANASSYFSYNGTTITLPYETPADVADGADIADWSPSVPNDSYADGGYDGADTVSTTDLAEMNVLGYDLACFAAGTRILTTRGPIAVEALRAGDVAVTIHGAAEKIIWIGRRLVACRRHPRPKSVWPVRVMAGAFGPAVPARDVRLSPDHAVFVRGVLIPVRYLINGASVVQEDADKIAYFHVELARHAVLLADGLPAESYLDTGNRGAFAGGLGVTPPHPDFALRVWDAKACARLVVAGAELVAARRRLAERATALGFAITDDPALHLFVNGQVFQGHASHDRHRFRVPDDARTVWLRSRHAAPAEILPDSDDHRRIGVAVSRIAWRGRNLNLDDPGLGAGWHDSERDWRWTDGAAEIFVSGGGDIEIDVAMAGPYWMPRSRGWRIAAASAESAV